MKVDDSIGQYFDIDVKAEMGIHVEVEVQIHL